jgi:hypothetical protein
MSHELVIEYMLSAHKEGLLQTGEYAFISFQLGPELLFHQVRIFISLIEIKCPFKRDVGSNQIKSIYSPMTKKK